MFLGCNKLVGAIKYSSNCTDGNYANTVNGYFTLKGTVSRPKKVYAEFTTADNTLTFKFSEEPTSTEGITIYNIPESGEYDKTTFQSSKITPYFATKNYSARQILPAQKKQGLKKPLLLCCL